MLEGLIEVTDTVIHTVTDYYGEDTDEHQPGKEATRAESEGL